MNSVTMPKPGPMAPPDAPQATDKDYTDKPSGGIDRLEIEPTDNGGFVAACFKTPNDDGSALAFSKPSKHSFSSFDELVSYLRDTLAPVPEPEAPPMPAAEPSMPPAEPPVA